MLIKTFCQKRHFTRGREIETGERRGEIKRESRHQHKNLISSISNYVLSLILPDLAMAISPSPSLVSGTVPAPAQALVSLSFPILPNFDKLNHVILISFHAPFRFRFLFGFCFCFCFRYLVLFLFCSVAQLRKRVLSSVAEHFKRNHLNGPTWQPAMRRSRRRRRREASTRAAARSYLNASASQSRLPL